MAAVFAMEASLIVWNILGLNRGAYHQCIEDYLRVREADD